MEVLGKYTELLYYDFNFLSDHYQIDFTFLKSFHGVCLSQKRYDKPHVPSMAFLFGKL